MAAMAIPMTARRLRRHHSTGTVAAANTGTSHHEWEGIVWNIDRSATARATAASGIRTSITIRYTPSPVSTPASTQSTALTPRSAPLIAVLRPAPGRHSSRHGVGHGLLLAGPHGRLLVPLTLHDPADPIAERAARQEDR